MAEVYPIRIDRGASFDEQWLWSEPDVSPGVSGDPIDLTGYTGALTIHETGAPGAVVLSATTTNGKMVLGGINGTIDMDFTAAETGTVAARDYYYVLELTSGGGIVYRVLEGIAAVRER